MTDLVGSLPRLAAALIAAVGLSGCTSIPDRVADFDAPAARLEIVSAPFYPQRRYQCGPAALLTVLAHSGVDASLGAVTDLTFIPGRKGSLRTELLATARHYDRLPYQIEGTMSALVDELNAGRPVLVLQNLGVSWSPRWHYAAVVGVDADSDHVILRSGTERRRLTKTSTFLRTWQRGERWAIVMLEPGELPANPARAEYFSAVADMDATAEPAYRRLLEQRPAMHAARNNLAYALAGQGRFDEALAEIRRVVERVDRDDPLREEYLSSARELESRSRMAD